jgi:hypothetical protein
VISALGVMEANVMEVASTRFGTNNYFALTAGIAYFQNLATMSELRQIAIWIGDGTCNEVTALELG